MLRNVAAIASLIAFAQAIQLTKFDHVAENEAVDSCWESECAKNAPEMPTPEEKIEEIDWIDITNNTLAEKETAKSNKELLRRLHVVQNEKVIEGAEAFLILWKKMPKYKFLYNFFKLPIIFTLFSVGYEIVAFFLYLKNKKQLRN